MCKRVFEGMCPNTVCIFRSTLASCTTKAHPTWWSHHIASAVRRSPTSPQPGMVLHRSVQAYQLGHRSNTAGNCRAGSSSSAQQCNAAVLLLIPAGSVQKQFKCLCTVFAGAPLFKVTSFGIWRSICSHFVFCYCDVKCGIKNHSKENPKALLFGQEQFQACNPCEMSAVVILALCSFQKSFSLLYQKAFLLATSVANSTASRNMTFTKDKHKWSKNCQAVRQC